MLFSFPIARAALLGGVLLAGFSFETGAGAQPAPTGSIPKNWRSFSSKAGAFSVFLPANPKAVTRGDGKNKVHVFYHAVPGGAYLVSYADFREAGATKRQYQSYNAQNILNANRDGLMIGARGKLVSEKRFTRGGFPARDVVYDIPQLRLRARTLIVLAKPFVYQVSALLPKNKAAAPTVGAFLNSFQTSTPRS